MIGLLGLMLLSGKTRDANEAESRLVETQLQTLDALEIAFLQARRAEKDFLLRREDSHVEQHAAALAEIGQQIDRARRQDGQISGSSAAESDFAALAAAVAAYQATFGELVASQRRLGLDEKSGLQGSLREAVHGIEKGLEAIGQPEMQVKMLMMRRHEKDFILRGDPIYLERLNARVDEFRAFPDSHYADPGQQAEIDRLLTAYQASFAAFVAESLTETDLRAALSDRFAEAEPVLARIEQAVASRGKAILARVSEANRQSRAMALSLGLAGLGLFAVLALWLSFAISRPLRAIRTALQQMMAGDYTHPLHATRITESAAIADAVEAFRRDLVIKGAIDKEIAVVIAACAAGDFSRRIDHPGEGSGSDELVRGVNAIGEAAQKGLGDVLVVLDALSQGDLTRRMPQGHQGVFGQISDAIDALIGSLSDILRQLASSSDRLNMTAQQIAGAADEASHRGQNSAASLEETAAALQTLAHTVQESAASARSAEEFVEGARSRAEATRIVADKAVDAISRIQGSSSAIGRITDMIEDVAFQTNLLALNAGVEAARAGEAGRGFAVVASEVRALAQRATEAAGEINDLIRSSEAHVADGVRLVSDSVTALSAIQESILHVVEKVTEIAGNTVDQATGITEINTAVGALDKDVQNNAATLEQTSAAGQGLRDEAGALVDLVRQFRLPTDGVMRTSRIAAE
ncbi:methyl-accepting chemotaxis protein [Rhodovulum strictum]|nr:methyl-accepting chemotaxis protein [Rhodovulum strictum]